jgi:hypothetical protein
MGQTDAIVHNATVERMTLAIPDNTKRARIVRQFAGPVESIQLRHIRSD